MTVRPPKQMWIGRPHERRLEVRTNTGVEAVAAVADPHEDPDLDAPDDGGGEEDGGGQGLLGKAPKGIPGVRGPKIGKPRIGKPNLSVGPGGVRMREPQVRAPHVRGPQLKQQNLRLDQLKMPSRGHGAPPPSAPLLPSQAVFRQKPWLPWWVAIVIPLLALLALLLFLFLPKNVDVPDVVGKKSAFEAEKAITEAGLRLAAGTKEQVDAKVPPGTVLSQTPKAGETAKKDSEVAILVAIGNGKVSVPDLTGKSPADAEKALRAEGLTLGQATPQPVDPAAQIKSQIPVAKEVVNEGAPIDIFTVVPGAGKDGKKGTDDDKAGGDAPAAAAGAGGGGGGEGGPVKVPRRRRRPARRLRAQGVRRAPGAEGQDGVRRIREGDGVPRRSRARHRGGGRDPRHAVRVRRLPRAGVRQRQGHPARRTPRPRSRSTRSPRARRTSTTRRGAPTAARSRTRATARSSSPTARSRTRARWS